MTWLRFLDRRRQRQAVQHDRRQAAYLYEAERRAVVQAAAITSLADTRLLANRQSRAFQPVASWYPYDRVSGQPSDAGQQAGEQQP